MKSFIIDDLIVEFNNIFKKNKELIKINKYFYNEITNINYSLLFSLNKINFSIKPPIDEELIERNFIIKRSLDMLKFFEYDINSRRACFVNNYDKYDNHCISYFHYYIRGNKLNLNIYVRSMNFDTNFNYDNNTFLIAYKSLYEKLKYVLTGNIFVNVFSLHKKN